MPPHDDDPTPPRGLTLPPDAPHAVPGTSIPARPRAAGANDDGKGMFTGLGLTVAVHALVLLTSMRLNRKEGNVSVRTRPAAQQVVETHLLRRGGGDLDPRRIVHRVTPTLAEREAPRPVALTRDPTAVQLRPDAGADEYMNAIITGRRRAPRGNQDLAEMERIAQMAAAEQAADPTAPPGQGAPTGSTVGDTNDPRLATQGAATKIDEFLRQHIRLTTALTGSERNTVVFRIRLDASGAIESASIATASGNESLDADILAQAQSLAEHHARVESLTPEETTAVSGRNINVRVPIAHLEH